MGIEVQLRTAQGDIVGEVADPKMLLTRATGSILPQTRLLKYLVPWGDAVFNQAQAEDLKRDIHDVLSTHANTPLGAMLSDVMHLVEQLSSDAHLYLWFVGD